MPRYEPVRQQLTRASRHLASGRPLDELAAIRLAGDAMIDAAEAAVRDALRSGASWTQIGHALGLSKQGAHQRYAHLQPPPG